MPNSVVALIEDEPLLRVPIARGLHDAGFTVIAAANGPEGLSLLEDPKIDIAIIDIGLPGRMDGLEVIREARRHKPTLKAIMTSDAAPPADVAGVGPFIAKPFAVDELVSLLRLMLKA